jgi:hypothetical protein
MRFGKFSFGFLRIDGRAFEHDVVIDRGEIRDRKKKPSKKFGDDFGHTPLSIVEDIPWKCRQLVIGTGAYGRLPVLKEVERQAKRHKIKLLILPTIEAIEVAAGTPPGRRNTAARIRCQEVFDLPPMRAGRTCLLWSRIRNLLPAVLLCWRSNFSRPRLRRSSSRPQTKR